MAMLGYSEPGLSLMINPGGSKCFRSNWTIDGKPYSRKLERRAKKWKPVFRKPGATTKESTASGGPDLSPDAVGRYPVIGLADARKWCLSDRSKAAHGIDPRPKPAPTPETLQTVGWAVGEFIEKHAKAKQRTWRQTERCLTVELSSLWSKPIEQVTKRELQAIIDRKVSEGHHTMAGIVRAWVLKLALLGG